MPSSISKSRGTKLNQKIIAVVGPTASGKSGWAKVLAQKFNGRAISADSRQIYKGMDIGTAKDKSFHQDLIDIIEPIQKFSVSDYSKLANDLIKKYLEQGNLPILVGGTGLYVSAVVYGYIFPDLQKESEELRLKLERMSEQELIEELKKFDPVSAERIDPQNKRRLVRALEVTILAQKPFSEFQKKTKPPFKALIIGIEMPREKLYARIDKRVDEQIKEGLIEEVRKLLLRYPSDLPSLNTIGYKEIIDYLKGNISLKEAIERIKFNTHAYVRKQETWFKRDPNIKWVSALEEAEKLVEGFLDK